METIKYIRLNDGILYELVPADHKHKVSDIEDFTPDLSKYDNSKSQFSTLKVFCGTSEPSNELGKDGDIYFQLEE